MTRRVHILSVLLLFVLAAPAVAARTQVVTDQLDRRVTVPMDVRRVVALQHQSLDIIVELGAADRIVGILRSWRGMIPGIDRRSPGLASLPGPGDLTTVNIEDLLQLKPDVVFVTNYAPPEMIQKIMRVGISVVVISLSEGEGTERARLNPTFADDADIPDARRVRLNMANPDLTTFTHDDRAICFAATASPGNEAPPA